MKQDDESTAVSNKHTRNKNATQYYFQKELSKSGCQSFLEAE